MKAVLITGYVIPLGSPACANKITECGRMKVKMCEKRVIKNCHNAEEQILRITGSMNSHPTFVDRG